MKPVTPESFTFLPNNTGQIVGFGNKTGSQIQTGQGAKPDASVPVVTGTPGNERTVFVDPRNPSRVVDPGLPKPQKVNPATAQKAQAKLTTLKVARTQLAKVKDAFSKIRNTASAGPGGQGKMPTPSGQSFDAAVDALRQTFRQLTRTPGEGAMSDWEGRLAMAALPNRNKFEKVTQQQIEQIEDLIATLESGYTEISSTPATDEDWKNDAAPH